MTTVLNPKPGMNGVPEIEPDELVPRLKSVQLIDVRGADEFTGELGHIPGAKLVTLGPDLLHWLDSADKERETVFICRSGGRSGQATMAAMQRSFKNVINLRGGMMLWNQRGLETTKG